MLPDAVRKELQEFVRGTVIPAAADHCTLTCNYLCAGFSTSKEVKRNFESQLLVKEEQVQQLSQYATANNLWVSDMQTKEYFLAEGGDSKVYFTQDGKHVIKKYYSAEVILLGISYKLRLLVIIYLWFRHLVNSQDGQSLKPGGNCITQLTQPKIFET